MRVLFIDDDPTGLATLRNSLAAHNQDWDIEVASTPAMAVLMTQRIGFEVVLIGDVPAYNGVDLFTHYAENHPETVRIAFIHDENRYRAMHTQTLAYQTVLATSEVTHIQDTIERSAELHRRLANPKLKHLITRVNGLPSPPRVIMSLNTALTDPDVSVNQVTDIVSEDVAIPARILHVVNTAYFALSRNMTNIREAVAYLGFDAVRNLALAVEMFRELGANTSPAAMKQIEILQVHSSAVAQMTRQFISHQQDAQDAFVGGLLHDVGHLVMATYFPKEYEHVRNQVIAGKTIYDAEVEMFGVSHTDIGAYLLHSWGLPLRIVDIVAFHHEAPLYTSGGMDAVHGVYIAEHLLAERREEGESYWEFHGLNPLRDEYIEALGLTERIMSWRTLHVGFGSKAS